MSLSSYPKNKSVFIKAANSLVVFCHAISNVWCYRTQSRQRAAVKLIIRFWSAINTILSCMISFKTFWMQNPLWLQRKKQGFVKDREQPLDFDTFRRSFPYYYGTSVFSQGVFRRQLRKTHLGMHNAGIYEIRFAWLDNHSEAGPRLPEDVINMSVRLLDINEQMHPVTTLSASTKTMRFMIYYGPLFLQG